MVFPVSLPVAAAPVLHSAGVFAALRLLPGDDLIAGLRRVQQEAGAAAMAVVACVGSLKAVWIRHADADEGARYEGRFEIVSLTGTVDPHHQHLHVSITDGQDRVFGGHLLPRSEIYTTAEIVALILPDLSFARTRCDRSGFAELTIMRKKPEA